METIFLKVLNMGIAAGWMILGVLFLRILLKRAPRAICCVLWAMVGIRLLCPVSLESVLSLIPSAETLPPEMLLTAQPAIESGFVVLDNAISPSLTDSLRPGVGDSVNPLQVIAFAASLVWMAGGAVMLLYALFSCLGLYRRVRAAMRLEGNLWICDAVESPFIYGILFPRIYLPSDLEEAQLACIIAHEKAHLKRRDHWWKPLGYLLLSVYWFQPLCWIAYFYLCRDIELACDERVVKGMGNEEKRRYAETLLGCSTDRHRITACPLAFGEVGVKERVKGVLYYKKPASWIGAVALAACVAVAVCFLTNPAEDRKGRDIPDTDDSRLLSGEEAAGVDMHGIHAQEAIRDPEETGNLPRQDAGSGGQVPLQADYRETLLGQMRQMTPQQWMTEQVKTAFAGNAGDLGGNGLEDGITSAILEIYSEHFAHDSVDKNVTFIGESHLVLGWETREETAREETAGRAGSEAVGEKEVGKTGSEGFQEITLYVMAQCLEFELDPEGKPKEYGGRYFPAVLTFSVKEEGVEWKPDETWIMGENYIFQGREEYETVIKEHFPEELAQAACLQLVSQSYIDAHGRACYRQMVCHWQTDTDKLIGGMVDFMVAQAGEDAAYNMPEYYTLSRYGGYTLHYIFSEFLKGGQTGARGKLLILLMNDLTGGSIQWDYFGEYGKEGQDYFDVWLEKARELEEEHGKEWMEEKEPYMWMLLSLLSAYTVPPFTSVP